MQMRASYQPNQHRSTVYFWPPPRPRKKKEKEKNFLKIEWMEEEAGCFCCGKLTRIGWKNQKLCEKNEGKVDFDTDKRQFLLKKRLHCV